MASPVRCGAIAVTALATVFAGIAAVPAPAAHAAPAAATTGDVQLSPYYTTRILARASDIGLSAIGPDVSLNDKGAVAFTGTTSAGEGIYVTDGSSAPTNVASALLSSSRSFGPATQINNNGQVLGRVRKLVSGGNHTYQLYRFEPDGSRTQIATGGPNFSPVDVIGNHPTFDNSGRTAFAGQCTSACSMPEGLLTPRVEGSDNFTDYNSLPMPSLQLRPQMADDGHIVVRDDSHGGRILLLDNALSPQAVVPIACATGCAHSGFISVGRAPGLDDGDSVVTFVGDRGHGPGVFASVANPVTGDRDLVLVAGERWDSSTGTCRAMTGPNNVDGIIGFDAGGHSLCFTDIDAFSRIAVARKGNRFIVTFLATPDAASRPNPFVPGRPLLFSATRGIFTVDVEITHQLGAPNVVSFVPRGVMKVAQVGDVVGGHIITALTTLHDPLTIPSTDDGGTARTAQPGDHRIAFQATTDGGDMVLRASHFDTDQDGLLDHWETTGLDVDSDGVPDLELAGMGADPNRKDMFLEIDWLADLNNQMNVPVRHTPEPGVTQTLAAMFAAHGITLHIDAGSGKDRAGNPLSVNMSGSLQGGDRIGMPGKPNVPPDVVLYESPADPAVPVPGVLSRSYDEIKTKFFGTTDKWAREFAFHYLLIADSPAYTDKTGHPTIGRAGQGQPLTGQVDSALNGGLPSITMKNVQIPSDKSGNPYQLTGSVLKITGACPAAGQLRAIAANSNTDLFIHRSWSRLPDSSCGFAVLDGHSGTGEVFIRPAPDNNTLPGNDFLVTLGFFSHAGIRPDAFLQWRTIAHELGHNLGLRHCGTTPDLSACTAASYPSLMNYAHQLDRSSTVTGYSTGAGGSFDDWSNLRLDFANSPLFLGNAFLTAYGSTGPEDEPSLSEYLTANPGLDVTAPDTTVVQPTDGETVGLGNALVVDVAATDASGVADVRVAFDTDGDGSPEYVPAVLQSGVYRVTFPTVSGPTGPRLVTAYAQDSVGNVELASVIVQVATSLATTTTITQISPAAAETGQPVTVHFTVIGPAGSGTPTGTVTVSDGQTSCAATVSQGFCQLVFDGPGQRTLTAAYGGDALFRPSVSPGQPYTVVTPNIPPIASVRDGDCTVGVGHARATDSAPTGTLLLDVVDADGDPVTVTVLSDSDPQLLPPDGLTVTDRGTTWALTVTAAGGRHGSAVVVLGLHDGTTTTRFPVTVIVPSTTRETGVIRGTDGVDMVLADNGGGTIDGGNGSDLICGGNGTDTLLGGDGDDILDGGNGADDLRGGAGNDVLRGGNGPDLLSGGAGADVLSGGSGPDESRDYAPAEGDQLGG